MQGRIDGASMTLGVMKRNKLIAVASAENMQAIGYLVRSIPTLVSMIGTTQTQAIGPRPRHLRAPFGPGAIPNNSLLPAVAFVPVPAAWVVVGGGADGRTPQYLQQAGCVPDEVTLGTRLKTLKKNMEHKTKGLRCQKDQFSKASQASRNASWKSYRTVPVLPAGTEALRRRSEGPS